MQVQNKVFLMLDKNITINSPVRQTKKFNIKKHRTGDIFHSLHNLDQLQIVQDSRSFIKHPYQQVF
jgi:hypothetical protein